MNPPTMARMIPSSIDSDTCFARLTPPVPSLHVDMISYSICQAMGIGEDSIEF